MSDPATILIVDDSLVVRTQLSKVLQEEHYNLLIAEDGQEAVEQIKEHGTKISLIFCDMRMPRLDGVGVLRWLKESPEHQNICFVMLTTEGSPGAIQEARALGAKGWIVKPFNPEMVVLTAKRITEKALGKKAPAIAPIAQASTPA